jgi:hypothetical protein
MPYYSFDLVVGEEFKNQGGIILEDIEVASDRADQLASELSHAARSRAGLATLAGRPAPASRPDTIAERAAGR